MSSKDVRLENAFAIREITDPVSSDPESYEDSDSTAKFSIYMGKVEEVDGNYLENRLVKVRVPVLHHDADLERIPYARLSARLWAECIDWERPGKIKIDLKGVIKGSLSETELSVTTSDVIVSGQEEVTGLQATLTGLSASGSASSTCPVGVPGQVSLNGQGSVTIAGTGSTRISAGSGSEKLKGSGSTKYDFEGTNLELSYYARSVTPWNHIRQGKDLIRKGDQVIVATNNGNQRDLIVIDLMLLG